MKEIKQSEVNIVKATNGDSHFISELTKSIVNDGHFSKRQLKVSSEYLINRLENPNVYVYVAKSDNRAIGYIDFESRTDGTVYVARLAVSMLGRGKRIGHMLLLKAEEVAIEKNCHKICLETLVACKKAQSLYLSHDFVPEGFLRNDGFHNDFIIMGKQLAL